MAGKIFDNYQGAYIKVGGVCYKFNGSTSSPANALDGDVEEIFISCLECETSVIDNNIQVVDNGIIVINT